MICSLDSIREDLIAWVESLWLEDVGVFRNGDALEPSLRSSLFMTYILYSIDAVDAIRCDKARWIAWIQAQQNAQDGSFIFAGNPSRRGIAFWNAVRGLNVLGSQIVIFPEYQREVMTVDGLHAWFDGWKKSGNSHHEVLALAPTLVSHSDTDWVEAFFAELAEQQHPESGTWPQEVTNISRTFAYSLIHMGMNRVPPQADKIVDAMLVLQDADGFWHGKPGFSTMDAVYLLSHLVKKIGWREKDAKDALHRVLDALSSYYEKNVESAKLDTHQFSAIVQTFALLSEALPERFATSYAWKFGWSNRAIWQCDVIKETLAVR